MALTEDNSGKLSNPLAFVLCAIALYIAVDLIQRIQDAFFGPLSRFPGPKIRALSNLPNIRTVWNGGEGADHLALHLQYGPIVRIGPRQLSFAGGAQAWRDIYGPKARCHKDWMFYGTPINGVDALITANDETHFRQRKLLSHAFSDRSLKDYEPVLKFWGQRLREELEKHADSGQTADMLKYFNLTTLDIMGNLCFGEGLGMLESSEYSKWVRTIFVGIKVATRFRAVKSLNQTTSRLLERFIFKSKTARAKQQEHFDYSKSRIDARLVRRPAQADLWTKILDKSPLHSPGYLSLEEHHSTADLFLIAGTETTASALSGILYYLLQNPSCHAQLVQEVRATFAGDSADELTFESLARLKYLQAVISEGLRMYPPAPIAFPRRVSTGGAVICDQYVPEDTVVGVHHLSTYRMPQHFKNASEFHPERWLHDAAYSNDHLDAVEPFSAGPRSCIGKNLAWFQLRLVIVTTVLHFDIELCPECDGWEEQDVFNMWSKKPLMCRLKAVSTK